MGIFNSFIFSAAIAGLILLIACVNFMNLSTARASSRAKEVGVRKVLGSLRKNLIQQFITESVLMSFIALTIAITLALSAPALFQSTRGKKNTGLWIVSAAHAAVVFRSYGGRRNSCRKLSGFLFVFFPAHKSVEGKTVRRF